jgi:thiamine-monophosphate kinase
VRITDLGEFSLIDRLKQIVDTERSDIVVGIDDDAAVLTDHGDTLLLATVDSHVEQVHYLPYLSTPQQIGRRALVVNLSDIAAMGGYPQFALVSLALPKQTDVEWVEELYRGMQAEAGRHGVAIIGGNITSSPSGVCIDITLIGRVHRSHLLLRSGAKPGDLVLVTGHVGEAFAGLHLVFNPRLPVDPAIRTRLITRYIEPQARVAEAAAIARLQVATAMIDVSDGLSGDIGHICEKSGVGVRVWCNRLPVSSEARQVAEAMDTPFWQFALDGGDDYGLCFTAPAEAVDTIVTTVANETGTSISVIGEIVPAAEGRTLVLPDDQAIPLSTSAWQHFRVTENT